MSNDIRKMINVIKTYNNINEQEDMRKWVECPRCDGSGELEHFRHIQGGKCFECGGKGVVPNDKVPEIEEKMKQEYAKRLEKRKEADNAMRDKTNQEWNTRYEFAIEFNTNVIEKVILPLISTTMLLKREDFHGLVSMAEFQNTNSGEDFLTILKDYGFNELYFKFEIAKYLQEKYGYNPLDYLKTKLDLKDFFLFDNMRDVKMMNKLPEKTLQTIRALIDKYRPQYEDIGREH